MTASCAAPLPPETVRGGLIIVGSGTQQGAINTWRDLWTSDNNRVSVNFSPDGQDVGLNALFARSAYVATTDQSLDTLGGEEARCGSADAFTLPTSITPIGVFYNLGSAKGLRLSDAVLAEIFAGNITRWDDDAIQSLNPTAELPAQSIVPVTSEAHSALTFASQKYISSNSPNSEDAQDGFTWPSQISGTRVPSDKDVAQTVDDTFGAIAFMNAAEIGNRFPAAALQFGENFHAPTPEKIEDAISASGVRTTKHGIGVDMATPNGIGYQLAAVNYQAFCSTYPNQPTAQLVKSWAEFVVSDSGQTRAKIAAGIYSPSDTTLKAAQKLAATISNSPS